MIFADVTDLSSLGIPGLLAVIAVLAGVVVLLYKDGKLKDTKIETIQDARLLDAKETRDKLTDSMEQQALLTKQIYDIVISNTSRRR